MRVAIGSDHAGFELKEAVKAFLQAENCEVLDVGTRSSRTRSTTRTSPRRCGAALPGTAPSAA